MYSSYSEVKCLKYEMIVLQNTESLITQLPLDCCNIAVFFFSRYQWFCHFDDDMFVNVPALSNLLSKYNPSDPLYIGRWDKESWHGPMSEEHYVGV